MGTINQSRFQFSNPEIESFNFKRNICDSEQENMPIELNNKIVKDREENKAVVKLTVIIGSTENSFEIAITMKATFEWEDDFAEDDIKYMLSHNAPALLLGYARQVVSFITCNSGLPPFQLPFFNFSID